MGFGFDARKWMRSHPVSQLYCDRLRFNLDPQDQVMSRIAGASARWEMSAVDESSFGHATSRVCLKGMLHELPTHLPKIYSPLRGMNSPAVFRQVLPDGSES